MAVAMTLVRPEITPDLYDAARKKVRWEEEPPDGCVLHVAWFASVYLPPMRTTPTTPTIST